MIDINNFIKHLKKNDLNFCCGVPDSLLKDLCFAFEKKYIKKKYKLSNN